jgi:hypothetical protein
MYYEICERYHIQNVSELYASPASFIAWENAREYLVEKDRIN